MIRGRSLLCIGLLYAGSCSRSSPSPSRTQTSTQTTSTRNAPAVPPQQPASLLDRLDQRAPVPLLPMMANHQKQNMRDHLVAVEEIVSALATHDFAAVQAAATRLGYSDQMGRMCTHMGSGATGFAEQALSFHHTADRVTAAARQRDSNGVLKELGATLRTCTACHATWKQRVVDEDTWQHLTAVTPPRNPEQGQPR